MHAEELYDLALKCVAGTVIFSQHVPDNLVSSVFMPLMFMDEAARDEFQKKAESGEVADIYEHLEKAGPRSINGFPMFMSMRTISKADMETLVRMIKKLESVREEVFDTE